MIKITLLGKIEGERTVIVYNVTNISIRKKVARNINTNFFRIKKLHYVHIIEITLVHLEMQACIRTKDVDNITYGGSAPWNKINHSIEFLKRSQLSHFPPLSSLGNARQIRGMQVWSFATPRQGGALIWIVYPRPSGANEFRALIVTRVNMREPALVHTTKD